MKRATGKWIGIALFAVVALTVTVAACSRPSFATGKEPEAIVTLQDRIEAVADNVGKSVVSIVAMSKAEPVSMGNQGIPWDLLPKEWRKFAQPQQPQQPQRRRQPQGELTPNGLGSGVIISTDGYILTNQHVIDGADKLEVTLADRRKFTARLIGQDPRSDLAVVKIEDARDLPAARLVAEKNIRRGLFVVAIGNPFGFGADGQASVSFGIVSGTDRTLPMGEGEDRYYGNLIQTDAAINPGNSGGPLCNLDGEVIGINVAIASRSGGSQGVGFAIPIDTTTLDIIDRLKKGETIEYGYLGVVVRDPRELESQAAGAEPDTGAFVETVAPGGPAADAGVMPADIITAVDGKTIGDADALVATIGRTRVGGKVKLTIHRSGKKVELDATIARRDLGKVAGSGEQPETPVPAGSYEWRGLVLRDLTPALREEAGVDKDVEGVYVDRVDKSSGAWERGLRGGMVIDQIASKKVKDVKEFKEIADKVEGPVFVNVVGQGPEVLPQK